MPANRAAVWATPITPASREVERGEVPPGGLGARWRLAAPAGGLAAEALAEEQEHAVDHEERGRRRGLGEDGPQEVLEHQAGDADRDGADDQEPGQALVGRVDLPLAGST